MTNLGCMMIDMAGVIVEADPAICATLRAPAEILIGSNLFDFTAPADRERCMHLFSQVQSNGIPVSTVKRLIRSDSSHLWIQSHVSIASRTSEGVRIHITIQDGRQPSSTMRPEALLKTARLTFEARRARTEIFSASLFADSAWDILLAAYISEAEGRVLGMADVATMLGMSVVNVTRWMRALSAEGLVDYEIGDDTQLANVAFRLSCDAHQRFERYLSERYITAVAAVPKPDPFM
ncbi:MULTISPECIES: PAS domain-containing protein [unclassified Sphingomonas]|jgi:PAS domain S-box-containing protein|uniref:PAS domain-containing protein n=1 Tax=Sphingomonas sp. PvP015 TaxID=3156388 RepID=UPI0033920D61